MRVVFSDKGFSDDAMKTNAINFLKFNSVDDIKTI